jgi:hypothetical protein
MEILELIRNADSAADTLALLSAYVETLRHIDALPEWCLRAPVEGAQDVYARMFALMAAVNATSQRLDNGRCAACKQALRVFAAAAWRLRSRRPGGR